MVQPFSLRRIYSISISRAAYMADGVSRICIVMCITVPVCVHNVIANHIPNAYFMCIPVS